VATCACHIRAEKKKKKKLAGRLQPRTRFRPSFPTPRKKREPPFVGIVAMTTSQRSQSHSNTENPSNNLSLGKGLKLLQRIFSSATQLSEAKTIPLRAWKGDSSPSAEYVQLQQLAELVSDLRPEDFGWHERRFPRSVSALFYWMGM